MVGNRLPTPNSLPSRLWGQGHRQMFMGLEVTNLLGPPGAFLALQEGPIWLEQQVLHYSEGYSLRISQPMGERQRSEAGSLPWYLRTTQLRP